MAGRLREQVPDNAVPVILAAIAFGGSFAHWVKLVERYHQHGLEAMLTAICADLAAFMCARERARDIREGRQRRGWVSWPTLAMVGAILLTLAGNVAAVQISPWGVTIALIPGVFLLLAISLMERRSAGRTRRQVAAKIAAERAEAEWRPTGEPSSMAPGEPPARATEVPSAEAIRMPSASAIEGPSGEATGEPESVPSKPQRREPRAITARPAKDPEAERAHRAYRKSVRDGAPLSDRALGAMFGRSRTWGGNRIAEVDGGPQLAEAAGE